jgi:hypothetical protein
LNRSKREGLQVEPRCSLAPALHGPASHQNRTKKELIMALLISVAPAGDGWAVRSEALDTELTFDRGARAEAAARALADRYADAGRHAEVRIFLRDGALAGRFLHPARAEPTAWVG